MQTTYRRTVSGKREVPRSSKAQGREKRRLAQLLVSFGLFLLVYIGQGLLPVQAEKWGKMIEADTDFVSLYEWLLQTGEGNWSLGLFGQEGTEDSNATGSNPQEQLPAVEVTYLSETIGHGLVHLYEYGIPRGLWDITSDETQAQEPEPEPAPEEPEIVTAVAQAYDEYGTALPSNVSFLYYELGLAQTAAPTDGTVSSTFGYRISPTSGTQEFHLALDIAAAEGADIRAYADGTVRYIGKSDEFGLYFMIDHDNGVSTFYAHCSKLLVNKGDEVTCGQTVALVGSTGNATGSHLHFTILKDGIRLDPSYYVDLSE